MTQIITPSYYKKEVKIVFAVGREADNYLLMSDLKKYLKELKIVAPVQDFGLLPSYISCRSWQDGH